jgi:hypothetical protein
VRIKVILVAEASTLMSMSLFTILMLLIPPALVEELS